MSLELLFLGTGTSAGIPMIGCACPVCRSDDPRDQRTRTSVVVSYPDRQGPRRAQASPLVVQGAEVSISPRDTAHLPVDDGVMRRLLIDTAPELRLQATRHGVNRIDGVLYTHAHADHIFGLDDLRRFNVVADAPLDIYADQTVLDRLRKTFQYIFEPHTSVNWSWVASLVAHEIHAGQTLELFGVRWTPLRLMHGRLPILGFRVDSPARPEPASAGSNVPAPRPASLAYCTDVSAIPPETYPLLAGLDVLVIDALRYRHHPTHLTVDQALDLIAQVRPKRAYLTHIAHDIKHAELEPKLPPGVVLPYDGMIVSIDPAARDAMNEATAGQR